MTKRASLATAFNRQAHVVHLDHPASPETARARRTLPVDLDTIAIDHRIRPRLDEEKIRALAHSMEASGLQSPILIRPDRKLDPAHPGRWGAETPGRFAVVAGAHRVTAARRLGWTSIEAMVIDADPAECQLIEIDENLARAENTPLDRARFLAVRKRLDTAAGRGGDRKSAAFRARRRSATGEGAGGYAEEAAAQTGLAPRTIRRAVAIGDALTEDEARVLAATPIARRESDLYRLARLAPRQRRRAVAAIAKADPPPRTLAQVLPAETSRSANGSQHDPADERAEPNRDNLRLLRRTWKDSELARAWGASSAPDRAEFIRWLARQQ